ncbi:MAG: 4a-hydroxytetrahydrobiopterin dehydratase [Acidobacteriota bacterium]
MNDLASRRCVPCQGGIPPLNEAEIQPLLAELDGWSVVKGHHLEKSFSFPDFAQALALVVAIGAIAEEQNHHPDLFLSWGRVDVRVWTHKIDGLTESDFIFAARCDVARKEMNV